MMRSLFSGVSGLRSHQVRMDVIGNNIANVNTVGFKRSRLNFQEMLVQNIRGSTAPQGGRGGTNPVAVGLGVTIGSIDTIFTQGSLQSTGKVTDLAIQGDGFFVLSDGSDFFYTRAGNFDLDRDGNLVDKGTGLKVMGWMADASGSVNTAATVTSLTIPVGRSYPPTPTSSITFSGNLNAGAAAGTSKETSIDIYDAQGAVHRIITTFTKTVQNEWIYKVSLDQGDPLIQQYLAAYYPDFSAMTSADQAAVLEQANQVFLGGYASASGLGSGTAGITVFANAHGTSGNGITVTFVKAGAPSSPTSVSVAGNSITVTLGTDAANNINATLQDVVNAINGDAAASALVTASLDPVVNGGTLAQPEGPVNLQYGSASQRTGRVIFTADGQVDANATRTANGATAPNLTQAFIFQPVGTDPVQVVPDLKDLTQYNAGFTAIAKKQNGNPSGTLQTISVAKDGTVSGVFSNGFTLDLGVIALANFNNAAGLFRLSDNLYKPSNNSGTAMVGQADTGGRGTVVPGTLEMSNVDLAQEFTDMIITQRGFQANTRVITASDEMLQELANLKR